jgi:hypothetical protein
MDRIIAISVFAGFYSLVSMANIAVNTPPQDLSKKKKWDFLGQHVSLIHAILAALISFYVYILEGGIRYNTPTNSYHIIVLGVISI